MDLFKVNSVKMSGVQTEENQLSSNKYNVKINNFLGQPRVNSSEVSDNVDRIKNKYNVMDKSEIKRISYQRDLFRSKDIEVISSLLQGMKDVSILDIGCNSGELILDRTKDMSNVSYILGVDCSQDMIDYNLSRKDTGCMDFACLDCESDDFQNGVDALYEVGCNTKFDLVVLSMVLLHVSNIQKVLSNVKKVLAPNGKVFIRDMDDGLSFAYPDTKNRVENILKISNKVPYTGYRKCGRELYSFLSKFGFNNIKVIDEIIDTSNKTLEEKDLLFLINFQYVFGDTELAYKNNKLKFEKDYIYISSNYDKLREDFKSDNFYYRMGTFIITASL